MPHDHITQRLLGNRTCVPLVGVASVFNKCVHEGSQTTFFSFDCQCFSIRLVKSISRREWHLTCHKIIPTISAGIIAAAAVYTPSHQVIDPKDNFQPGRLRTHILLQTKSQHLSSIKTRMHPNWRQKTTRQRFQRSRR